MNGNVWRAVAIALMTFMLGAGSTWFSTSNKVTKDDVLTLIHSEAPSTADLTTIRQQLVAMQVAQARLEEKMDLILNRVNR